MADANFPNRPDHPDFYALALTVQDNDHAANNATDGMFDDMISRHVDRVSLLYMAHQRGLRSAAAAELTGASTGNMLMSTWIDGFMAGVNFDIKRRAFDIAKAVNPDAGPG